MRTHRGLRGAEWNFPRFLYISLPPVILYLQPTLLVSSTSRLVDSWRDHYYSISPIFFGLNALFGLGMLTQIWVVENVAPAGLAIAISCMAILASLVCAVTRKPLVHGVLLALIAGINLLSVFSIAFSPVQD